MIESETNNPLGKKRRNISKSLTKEKIKWDLGKFGLTVIATAAGSILGHVITEKLDKDPLTESEVTCFYKMTIQERARRYRYQWDGSDHEILEYILPEIISESEIGGETLPSDEDDEESIISSREINQEISVEELEQNAADFQIWLQSDPPSKISSSELEETAIVKLGISSEEDSYLIITPEVVDSLVDI